VEGFESPNAEIKIQCRRLLGHAPSLIPCSRLDDFMCREFYPGLELHIHHSHSHFNTCKYLIGSNLSCLIPSMPCISYDNAFYQGTGRANLRRANLIVNQFRKTILACCITSRIVTIEASTKIIYRQDWTFVWESERSCSRSCLERQGRGHFLAQSGLSEPPSTKPIFLLCQLNQLLAQMTGCL